MRGLSGIRVVCRSQAFEVRGVIEGWVTRGAVVAEWSTYESCTIVVACCDMHRLPSQPSHLTAVPPGVHSGVALQRPKLALLIFRTLPPLHCIDMVFPSQTIALRSDSTCDTTTGTESNQYFCC